ncbi:hypothetical protein Tsubulata_001257 [Turnera subulata]|uniref:Uncharacterized protein n=1 Tax=Turnera subulata TaxID=218843 RepID=A0A9Q0FLJ7_9ROSI|nr:hypothetical protein Tsubulata_001257 [Turnera subulata]
MDMRTSKIGGTSATTTAPTTNSATNTNATWRVEKKRMESHRITVDSAFDTATAPSSTSNAAYAAYTDLSPANDLGLYAF